MERHEPNEDRDGLAAEYVLGTLDAEERAEAERLIAADPQFAAEVSTWESRLAPLALTAESAEPPAEMLGRILERIDDVRPSDSSTVVRLNRRVRIWQTTTAAAAALAAALALAIVFADRPPELQERYVAALQADGETPAFVAIVDLAQGTISVRQVGAEAPEPGRSYELWAVGGGREQPQSLGVVDAAARVPIMLLNGERGSLGQTMLAVSLEPEGGSPTGQPTGPVLFTGQLVPAE